MEFVHCFMDSMCGNFNGRIGAFAKIPPSRKKVGKKLFLFTKNRSLVPEAIQLPCR